MEQEQQGSKRAEYGKHVIALASKALTEEFGKGYSETNIRSFRRFYLEFKDIQIQQTVSAEFREKIFQIQQTISAESDGNTNPLPIPLKGTIEKENVQTLSSQLSWSHYERLMRVSDLQAREWYMKEAVSQQWNFQTLKRNIDTQYYYRLMQTPDAQKQVVIDEMQTMTADFQKEKSAFVKNPMLVEFLGLNQDTSLTETDKEC